MDPTIGFNYGTTEVGCDARFSQRLVGIQACRRYNRDNFSPPRSKGMTLDPIEELRINYKKQLDIWTTQILSPEERIWYAVYEPRFERRLRFQLGLFEATTKESGRRWERYDVTGMFERWISGHRYSEAYFKNPRALTPALATEFPEYVVDEIKTQITTSNLDDDTVVAIVGVPRYEKEGVSTLLTRMSSWGIVLARIGVSSRADFGGVGRFSIERGSARNVIVLGSIVEMGS